MPTDMKKTYGLLGRNIAYSFSRKYFNTRFENENIAAIYKNFDIEDIKDFATVLKSEAIHGMNVTIPYKLEVMPYLDQLSTEAQAIGAVNVIKFEDDGTLTGHNSDYYGFKESLLPLLKEKPEYALILGTGGASKAVAYALESLGINYTYVSRSAKPGQLTYAQLTSEVMKKYLLIVNTTPLGTFPSVEACPGIPYELLTSKHMLFDLIYNPEETAFMRKGKARGASVLNGDRMLVLQAERSWEIWNS